MKDIKAQLEKLQVQIAECELIRDLATDPKKCELFDRLSRHFKILVAELEDALPPPGDTFLGRKSYEPFLKGDE